MKKCPTELSFENNFIFIQEDAASVQRPLEELANSELEILLDVKQPKQVQLQDLFHILIPSFRFVTFFLLLLITLLKKFFSIIHRHCVSF